MTEPIQNLKTNFLDVLKLREYDPNFIPPNDQILFTIQNETIGSLQNFVVFSGLPKAGKSRFLTGAIASNITGNSIFTMQLKTIKDRPKIAWFDTESSISDFYRNIDQLKKFSNVSELPKYLRAFHTRQDSPKMQKRLIIEYLKNEPDTSVLIIDGLLDLCINYNDETETRNLINWLKKITTEQNILILCVLHTGKDGSQRLGHLGANTDRWAQSTLTIKKDENKFILESKFLRSSIGFTSIEIEWDKITNTFIQTNNAEILDKIHFKNYDLIKHSEKIKLVFSDNIRLNYDNTIKRIQEIEHRGVTYCKDYFKFLKEKQLISQDLNGLWFDNSKLF